MLQRPDGATELLPQPSGAPLGVGGVPFESVTLEVPDGSRLVLYTDGLVESRDVDIDDGLRRLAGRSRTDHRGSTRSATTSWSRWTGRRARRRRRPAGGRADRPRLRPGRDLAADGGVEPSPRPAAWVRGTLADWDLEPLVELAELLVSELVTNALRHASGPIELTALLLDESSPSGSATPTSRCPRLRKAKDADEGGRGLQLVAMLAARWGARPTAEGKVVWCELPRSRP